jgi:hypothetical protein
LEGIIREHGIHHPEKNDTECGKEYECVDRGFLDHADFSITSVLLNLGNVEIGQTERTKRGKVTQKRATA